MPDAAVGVDEPRRRGRLGAGRVHRVAATPGTPVAAFENGDRRLFGVQYHPEVVHSTFGQEVLAASCTRVAGIAPDWTTGSVIDEQVARIRARSGDARVICGLSGGVDSAVAAALVQRAVGDQLTCVFVDHGLLRAGEREQVERDYVAATGINLVTSTRPSASWRRSPASPTRRPSARSSAGSSSGSSRGPPARS